MSVQNDVTRPNAFLSLLRTRSAQGTGSDPSRLRVCLSGVAAVVGIAARLARRSTAKHCAVFVLRTSVHFRTTVLWIHFLESYGGRHHLGPVPMGLARRSLATHLVYGSDCRTALARSCAHQMIAAGVFGHELLRDLWAGRTTEIARVTGRREIFRIELCRSDLAGARHEGELTISLCADLLSRPLCRLTFAFVRRAGRSTLVIGGLQGSGLENAKTAMIAATRDLGGLRPKDALLLALEGLAHRMGAKEIHAVSDETHVINRRARRRRILKVADYDAYWRDRHGSRGGPFGFVLPIGDHDLAVEPDNRRARAKRRFVEVGLRPW